MSQPALLDDPAALRAADPAGALAIAAGLGEQLRHGHALGLHAAPAASGRGVRSIVLCGMGGSGIGGDVVRALYGDRLSVPVVVVKGYTLPAFADPDALVLVLSFSGGTEEALACYGQATRRGCRVVVVAAGGELAARAERDGATLVGIPPGLPMPRTAIGYLAGGPLGVLEAAGLVPPAGEEIAAAAEGLAAVARRLGPEVPSEANEAKGLAAWIGERIPIVWGSQGVAEVAAARWRTQVNENAKGPALSSALPELDHHEIEGWSAGAGRPFALVVLRHEGEYPRIAPRVAATFEAIESAGLEHREVWAEGRTPIAALFSLVMVGDHTSVYLALLRGVDPMPVPVLMGLKDRLAR